MHNIADTTQVQRVALLAWWLAQDHAAYTAGQLAQRLALPPDEVAALLVRLAYIIPIYRGTDGKWGRMQGRTPGQLPTQPAERAALLGWLFALGAQLTRWDVARACGLSPWGAGRLLNTLSRTLPIYSVRGVWRAC